MNKKLLVLIIIVVLIVAIFLFGILFSFRVFNFTLLTFKGAADINLINTNPFDIPNPFE